MLLFIASILNGKVADKINNFDKHERLIRMKINIGDFKRLEHKLIEYKQRKYVN